MAEAETTFTGAPSYTHLLQAFDHDALTGLQPFVDDPQVPDPFSHRDRTDTYFVVVANDCDLLTSLELNHGPLRNQQGAVLRLDGSADAAVAARTKKFVRIRKDTRDPYGAGGGVHFSVGEVDGPSPLIDAAVRHYQVERDAPTLLLPRLHYVGNLRWKSVNCCSLTVK